MELEDEIHALCLNSSLSNSWENLVSLSNSTPDGVLTLKMMKENMLNEEKRRKELGLYTQSQVLVSKKQGRSKSKNSKSHDKESLRKGLFQMLLL